MSNTDCLVDPALCGKGLSLGMSVKFDKSVNDSKEPRYLLDTGAQSSQTRGVSMYIKEGKVFFNLAISQKSWEVGIPSAGIFMFTRKPSYVCMEMTQCNRLYLTLKVCSVLAFAIR